MSTRFKSKYLSRYPIQSHDIANFHGWYGKNIQSAITSSDMTLAVPGLKSFTPEGIVDYLNEDKSLLTIKSVNEISKVYPDLEYNLKPIDFNDHINQKPNNEFFDKLFKLDQTQIIPKAATIKKLSYIVLAQILQNDMSFKYTPQSFIQHSIVMKNKNLTTDLFLEKLLTSMDFKKTETNFSHVYIDLVETKKNLLSLFDALLAKSIMLVDKKIEKKIEHYNHSNNFEDLLDVLIILTNTGVMDLQKRTNMDRSSTKHHYLLVELYQDFIFSILNNKTFYYEQYLR